MPFLADRVLDLGLNVLTTEATRFDWCSTEPTTYAQATGSASLANKTSLAVGSPASRTPSGRRVTVPAISDGAGTADGTATSWALTDPANSRLLATGALASSVGIANGNLVTVAAFDIGIPGVA
jgi:hypothetical protein